MESSIMLKGIWWFVKTWLRGFMYIIIGLILIAGIVAAFETGWLQWLVGVLCLIALPLMMGIIDNDLP